MMVVDTGERAWFDNWPIGWYSFLYLQYLDLLALLAVSHGQKAGRRASRHCATCELDAQDGRWIGHMVLGWGMSGGLSMRRRIELLNTRRWLHVGRTAWAGASVRNLDDGLSAWPCIRPGIARATHHPCRAINPPLCVHRVVTCSSHRRAVQSIHQATRLQLTAQASSLDRP